jgi:hypothetical protein
MEMHRKQMTILQRGPSSFAQQLLLLIAAATS